MINWICPFTLCFANKMTLMAKILGVKVHLRSGGLNWREQNAGWWRRMLWRLFSGLVLHCDSNRLKLAEKLNSPKLISRVFPRKFLQIHITSVSGHCMRFTFKCVKSKFSNLIFGGSLTFGPTLCRRPCFWHRHASTPLGEWRYVSQHFLLMVITSLQSLFASKMNERLVEAPL